MTSAEWPAPAKIRPGHMVTRASLRIRSTGLWHRECYDESVMSDRDEHLEVMRAMWGEMKTLNARINTMGETLGGRIDAMGQMLAARIDATNERLDRLSDEVREGFAQTHLDRRRLDRLEKRVDALEGRER